MNQAIKRISGRSKCQHLVCQIHQDCSSNRDYYFFLQKLQYRCLEVICSFPPSSYCPYCRIHMCHRKSGKENMPCWINKKGKKKKKSVSRNKTKRDCYSEQNGKVRQPLPRPRLFTGFGTILPLRDSRMQLPAEKR